MKKNKFSANSLLTLVLLFVCTISLTAQSWQQKNDTPFLKHHNNGYGLNGKGYVFEGTNNTDGPSNISNELWEYTPGTDSWVRLADFTGPGRGFAIGDEWNDKYYYGFGNGANTTLNDLWVFDPIDTSFTELPSCPCEGRAHPAFVAHNDKIYMGSGSNNGNLRDWWEYDMITQVWTQKPDIPGPARHHPFQFAIGDYIYVGGGHQFNWIRFDPSNDTWSEIDNTPGGRVAGSQFSYNEWGFLLAGDDAAHDHIPDNETFMAYNPDADQWIELPSLPNGSRWANSSMIIDDILYFFGGLDFQGNPDDMSMWTFDMSSIDCLPAENPRVTSTDTSYVDIIWGNFGQTISDTLRWREMGATEWNSVPNPQVVYRLDGLSTCQEYQFQVVTVCENNVSESDIIDFSTSGCCSDPGLTILDIANTTVDLEWNPIVTADAYVVRWRPDGSTTWFQNQTSNTELQLILLDECTEYECQINSVCDGADPNFDSMISFRTKGCGACLDLDFCGVQQSFQGGSRYINKVTINDYENVSGDDQGYGEYVADNTKELAPGTSFELGIESAGTIAALDRVTVWIDLNANGVFETGEVVLNAEAELGDKIYDIDIPASATEGKSRIRVMLTDAIPAQACHDEFSTLAGEAEDYCIEITDINSVPELIVDGLDINVYPNPFSNMLSFKSELTARDGYQLEFVSALGERIMTKSNHSLNESLDLSNLSAGLYFLNIRKDAKQQTIRIVKH